MNTCSTEAVPKAGLLLQIRSIASSKALKLKRLAMAAFLIASLVSLSASLCSADQTDLLLEKLVEKEILTESEAAEIKTEVEEEQETKKADVETEAEAVAKAIPDWIKNSKLKGYLRTRYDTIDREYWSDEGRDERGRGRITWRLGFETDVNDHWKGGFGIASGDGDPRSRNIDFGDTFSTTDVQLELAWFAYKPIKTLSLVGGKFENPIWRPKDLTWDGDVKPEGLALVFDNYMIGRFGLFASAGYYFLDEFRETSSDPYLLYGEFGTSVDILETLFCKLSASYYDFSNLQGNAFEWSGGSNSTDADGNLIYEYDAYEIDAEVGTQFGEWFNASVFGQYVESDADSENKGFLAGLKFGHKKVKALWDWQVKYNYRYMGRDAFPDFLPDSDFYDGQTDAKGHEVEGKLGVAKHVALGFDYYFNVEPIERSDAETGGEEKRLQLDVVIKY